MQNPIFSILFRCSLSMQCHLECPKLSFLTPSYQPRSVLVYYVYCVKSALISQISQGPYQRVGTCLKVTGLSCQNLNPTLNVFKGLRTELEHRAIIILALRKELDEISPPLLCFIQIFVIQVKHSSKADTDMQLLAQPAEDLEATCIPQHVLRDMEKIAILGIRSCHRHLAEEEHEGNRKYKPIRKWALLVLWDREQHLPFFLIGNFIILQKYYQAIS